MPTKGEIVGLQERLLETVGIKTTLSSHVIEAAPDHLAPGLSISLPGAEEQAALLVLEQEGVDTPFTDSRSDELQAAVSPSVVATLLDSIDQLKAELASARLLADANSAMVKRAQEEVALMSRHHSVSGIDFDRYWAKHFASDGYDSKAMEAARHAYGSAYPDYIIGLADGMREETDPADTQQIISALESGIGVITSLNDGRMYQGTIAGDDEPVYWQRQEFIRWAKQEIRPEIQVVLDRLKDSVEHLTRFPGMFAAGGLVWLDAAMHEPPEDSLFLITRQEVADGDDESGICDMAAGFFAEGEFHTGTLFAGEPLEDGVEVLFFAKPVWPEFFDANGVRQCQHSSDKDSRKGERDDKQ